MKIRFLTAGALLLAAGMVVGCSETNRPTHEYAYPHQKRVDTRCWDGHAYGHDVDSWGGYRGTPRFRKTVYFDTGSSSLTAEGQKTIEEAARIAKNRSFCGSHIAVVGHTDNTGGDELNQKLAAKRAETVQRALVNAGVPGKVLITESLGEEAPLDTNDTVEGRANNRRVVFEAR
jgi:outer membrane protein OmpA-like peptidoglycan-associated protein